MNSSKTVETTKATDYKFLQVSSDAFNSNGMIPSQYTCDGINTNPSLHIEGIPPEAKSLALIVDDPDAPHGSFCHCVAWNIPVTKHIKENAIGGLQGMNDFSRHQYSGPCPPSGTHRYFFKLYALDCTLDLPVSSGKMQLERAMSDHVIGFGVLTGNYKRKH